jgi:hypothetical protein
VIDRGRIAVAKPRAASDRRRKGGENLANNLRLPASPDKTERIARYKRALARLDNSS